MASRRCWIGDLEKLKQQTLIETNYFTTRQEVALKLPKNQIKLGSYGHHTKNMSLDGEHAS